MRLATLALNLGFLFTSFSIGVFSGRQQAPAAVIPERLPVAGPGAGEATPPANAESSAADAAEADQPPPQPQKRAAPARAARRPAPTPPAVPEIPSWSQVAARAQAWTAAVRADQNYGAGVIVSHSGLVITNWHVVEGAHSVSVTPFGAEPAQANVLDSDRELDVALLDFSRNTPNSALLGSARALAVGDEVLAVGSPRKMYFSVSRGMVSFPNRFLDGVEYVQTDLPINVGNSGGPLVDREGRLVGIISFILRDSQGISFALPIDRALARFAKYLTADASRPRAPSDAAPVPVAAH